MSVGVKKPGKLFYNIYSTILNYKYIWNEYEKILTGTSESEDLMMKQIEKNTNVLTVLLKRVHCICY